MKKFVVFVLVMTLMLTGCGHDGAPEEIVETAATRMVMVDGVLYYDTQTLKLYDSAEGVPEYWITSTVAGDETPAENDQSNFGDEYGYRYGERDGTVEVLMWTRWYVFATEEVKAQMGAPDDPEKRDWGITLTARDVTPTGMTLIITQDGGDEITGELNYGCDYRLETWQEGVWTPTPYAIEGDWAWTAEAYLVTMGGSNEEVENWERLYGALPAGQYRLLKGIMDYRAPGDYDKQTYAVEFVIE